MPAQDVTAEFGQRFQKIKMIKKIPIQKLTTQLFEELVKLCHSPAVGYMAMQLDFCYAASHKYKKKDFQCEIYVKFNGKKVLGWLLAQDLVYRHKDYLDIGVFVSKENRGNGIASQLLEAAINSNSKLSAWASDELNVALYKKYRNQVTIFDMKEYSKTGKWKKFKF